VNLTSLRRFHKSSDRTPSSDLDKSSSIRSGSWTSPLHRWCHATPRREGPTEKGSRTEPVVVLEPLLVPITPE